MSSPIVETQEASTIKSCQKFEGHTDWVEGAIHLPDRKRMMTCSRDGSLRIWDLKSGKQIGEDWRDGDSKVWTISLSPDGTKVVSGSEDGVVRLWDMDTCKVTAKWTGHTETVRSVCWIRDGRRVVSGSMDGTARVWDVEKGETILGPIETRHKIVFTVVYSPDMTMFATGGDDRPRTAGGDSYSLNPGPDSQLSEIKIWDEKTRELVATLKGHTGSVMCLAWTPDGKTLISGSVDSSIRTWSTSNWKQIAVLDELEDTWNSVHGIAISPNGRILASALFDNTVRLWNLDNNKPISSPLNHANRVAAVSFSADGKLLATCCDDNNAYTWDVYAIFKKAGLEYLLLDKPDKSLLAQAHVSRRPVRRQPVKASHAYLSAKHRLRPISSPSHGGTLRSRFLSLFRPIHHDTHDAPSRPRPFHWVRKRLFARPSGADIKLHEHPSAIVDVPYAKGKRRNASARERRRLILKILTASRLRPPNSTLTQQSSSTAKTQSSL